MPRSKWLERQLRDRFVAAASEEGWRSRAAFKLMQINKRFKIIRQGYQIVDLGAAPGGWSQYVASETNCQVQSKTTDNAMHLFKNSGKFRENEHPSSSQHGDDIPKDLHQRETDCTQPFLAIDQRYRGSAIAQHVPNSGSNKAKRRRIMDIATDESEALNESGHLQQKEREVPLATSLPAGSRVCVTKTRLLSVDLLPIQPVPGSVFICGDFNDSNVRETVTKYLRKGQADVVMSDMVRVGIFSISCMYCQAEGIAYVTVAFVCGRFYY
eukprot:gb/GECG01009195.1/.p1 GENE.gb/GECG01009195.1/~~gb/GECG01009195.1/.p1  ORF type:complete len:269 (+),score=21.20 gb/GECG01009195.1/:1-807(+)